MSKWLVETIDSFGIKMQQKQDKQFNVLQSAMILLIVIHRLDSILLHDGYNYFLKDLEEKHYRVLFQGLCTIPDWKSNIENWPDFTAIEGVLFKSNTIKRHIVDVLIKMHRRVSSQSIPEVLFSIPIFHFAKGMWEPFKDVTKLLTIGPEFRGSFNQFKETTTKW